MIVSGGLLFIVGAAAACGAVYNFAPGAGGHPVYGVISLLIALPAIQFGLIRMLRRSGFVLDLRKKTITSWSRVLFHQSRELDLGGFNQIMLVRFWFFNRIARGEKNYYYRVHLIDSRDARPPLELFAKLKESNARKIAACLARFLELPVAERRGRAEGVNAGR